MRALSASCRVQGSFRGAKAVRWGAFDLPTPSTADVKNEWNYMSTPSLCLYSMLRGDLYLYRYKNKLIFVSDFIFHAHWRSFHLSWRSDSIQLSANTDIGPIQFSLNYNFIALCRFNQHFSTLLDLQNTEDTPTVDSACFY